MEAPLVNEYKQPFIWRRLLQTLLGGIRLALPHSPPFHVYVLQMVLFVVPLLSLTTFLVFEEHHTLSLEAAAAACGGALFLFCLGLQGLSYSLRRRPPKQEHFDQPYEGNAALDEEFVLLDGWLGAATWRFLVPGKGSLVVTVTHAAAAGLTAAVMLICLRPEHVADLLHVPWGAAFALCVLGVWSTNVGVWGLVTVFPPEPAVFSPLLPYHLAALSRPAHLLTAALFHLLHSVYPDVWLSCGLNWAGHVAVAGAWLLWTLGALPPIDAFLLWLLEQWHVLALGGSPCASSGRLVWQAAVGTFSLAVVAALPSFPQRAVAAALLGLLLALDYGWMLTSIVSRDHPRTNVLSHVTKLRDRPTRPSARDEVADGPPPQSTCGNPTKTGREDSDGVRLSRLTVAREAVLGASLLLLVLGVSIAVHLPLASWFSGDICLTTDDLAAQYPDANLTLLPAEACLPDYLSQLRGETPTLLKSWVLSVVGLSWVVLGVACLCVTTLQQVWLAGLVRNPFWTDPTTQTRHVEAGMMYLVAQALTLGVPVAGVLGMHLWFAADECRWPCSAAPFSLPSLLHLVPLARAFRTIWTCPYQSMMQLGLFYLLEVCFRGGDGDTTPPALWWYLSLPAWGRVMALSLCRLWGRRALHHAVAVCLMCYTSVADTKQRRPITVALVAVDIALMPAVWLLIGAASVLSAPLLPLFTLPLFLLGFPRPQRFWPYPVGYSANACGDTVYYEQLVPHLVSSLHSFVSAGVLGEHAEWSEEATRVARELPTPTHLWRGSLPRLASGGLGIYIRGTGSPFPQSAIGSRRSNISSRPLPSSVRSALMLEVGFSYHYYSVKGLELQETSCHTVEASKVDAVMSRAFDTPRPPRASCPDRLLNNNVVHTLTALTKIPVLAYSDTKNVLTGVIDSNDFLSVVPSYFIKAVVFLLLDYSISRPPKGFEPFRRGSESAGVMRDISGRRCSAGSAKSRVKAARDSLTSLPKLNSESDGIVLERRSVPDVRSNVSRRPSRDVLSQRQLSVDASDINKDNKSLQSGRGSRLAWVNKTMLNSISDSPTLEWEQEDMFTMNTTENDETGTLPPLKDEEFNLHLLHRKTAVSRHTASSSTPPYGSKSQNFLLSPRNVSPASSRAAVKNLLGKNIPGFMSDDSEDEDKLGLESKTDDDLPSVGGQRSRQDTLVTKVNLRVLSRNEPVIPKYNSGLSEVFAPPAEWLEDLPFNYETVDDFQSFFPVSWFKFLLSHLARLHLKARRQAAAEALAQQQRDLKKARKMSTKSKKRGSLVELKPMSGVEQKYGSEQVKSMPVARGDPTAPVREHINRETDDSALLRLMEDEQLVDAFRLVVATCCLTLLRGSVGEEAAPTPSELRATFSADLPASTELEWLISRHHLHHLCFKAYRLAVKVSLDHVLIGLNSSSWPDLLEALTEYHTRWYFGPDDSSPASKAPHSGSVRETTTRDRVSSADLHSLVRGSVPDSSHADGGLAILRRGASSNRVSNGDGLRGTADAQEEHLTDQPHDWADAIRKEVPNLFSVGYNEVKGVYTSHLASLRVTEVGVARLAPAVVTALWAALGPELLYFTNDDDERYSIQAHASLLRNLTVQAADPPLGYPIYASPPLRFGPPWLCAHSAPMRQALEQAVEQGD